MVVCFFLYHRCREVGRGCIANFSRLAVCQASDSLDQALATDQTGDGPEQSSDQTSAEGTTGAAFGTVSLS